MKKVLINCVKKFKDSLFVNSPLLKGKNFYELSESNFLEILHNNQITIVDKKESLPEMVEDFDFIIIDDLLNYKVENKKSIYYFIPPIDFNISDPFITDRWPRALTDSNYPNKVAWSKTYYPNLKFLGSNIFESENQLLDLSLVLNLNNHNDNWGVYHFAARELFKSVKRKKYKLDYCFREVKKENRVKFFLDLINNFENNISEIKISAHGGFFNDITYYNEVKNFFESQNLLSIFLEFEKIDKNFFSFDTLIASNYNIWPVNKLFLNTFSSDISIYFETAREKEGILNTMNYLITEKTIDLLNIGKPFIHLSSNVDVFLKKFGFKNYTELKFNEISDNKIELIKKVAGMHNPRYERLINELKEIAEDNVKILDSYYKENTFLNNLIHN